MGKIKNTHRFGTTPNTLLNNKNISLKAKGLYGFMDSKPENWDFTIKGIASQIKEEYDAIKTGLDELIKFGYLTRKSYQNERGQWDTDYQLFPLGDAISDKTGSGSTGMGKHRTGSDRYRKTPDISNKEEVKKNKEDKEERASDTFYLEMIQNNPTYEMLRSKKFPALSDDDIEVELLLIGERYKYKRADFTTIINWLSNVNGKQIKYNPQNKNKESNSSVQPSSDRYIALHAESFYKVAFMTSKEIEAEYDKLPCKYFIGSDEVTRQQCIDEIIRLNTK